MEILKPVRQHSSRGVRWAAISLAAVSVLAAACGTSTATPAAATTVLTPSYARSAGYPKTLDAAKTTSVTSEKGCTTSHGAVYADSTQRTALISSVLNCDSATSASAAFSSIRKHYGVDAAMAVPKGLGTSAFATASIAPQYLMVWETGTKVAITAVDVDLAASTTTSSTVVSPPITTAQEQTLSRAAEAQNALLK